MLPKSSQLKQLTSMIKTDILIIGAGAAVESILYRVAIAKPKKITIINRTIEKADRLIRKFGNMTKIKSLSKYNNAQETSSCESVRSQQTTQEKAWC